jgi:hypothetical protein
VTNLFLKLQRHSLVLLAIFLATALLVPSPARVAPYAKAPQWQAGAWINSPPLRLDALKGKVVVLEFWTYG